MTAPEDETPQRHGGPVRSAVGLVTFAARTLPKVSLALVRLPLTAAAHALGVGDALRHGGDAMVSRGAEVVEAFRGRTQEPGEPATAPPRAPAAPPPPTDSAAAPPAPSPATAPTPPPSPPAAARLTEPDGAGIDREDLPIPDFDNVTAGSLRGRLRRLDLDQLRTLRSYEQAHGARLPILTMLDNRIAKLEAGAPEV